MERTRLGRDFGLSVRMAVALLFVAAMYLLALLLSFAVLVSVIADRAWGALLGWFIFAAALVIVAVMHWLHGDDLVLRTVRAKRLERDEQPKLREILDRLAATADVPPPDLAVIRSWAPNALAAGMTPDARRLRLRRSSFGASTRGSSRR